MDFIKNPEIINTAVTLGGEVVVVFGALKAASVGFYIANEDPEASWLKRFSYGSAGAVFTADLGTYGVTRLVEYLVQGS